MNAFLPRAMAPVVEKALRAFPVVVLTGPRQAGKTTLVQHLASAPARQFRTLDDLRVLELARREPELLVREAKRLTLDEVQRAPDLLLAVKRAVDEQRESGRYLLTGSANLLLMRAVSESLAGRAVYLRLGPMSEAEKAGHAGRPAWTPLMRSKSANEALRVLQAVQPWAGHWQTAALQGGYPATRGLDAEDRSRWFEGYVATYIERDLQQLASISALADFRRLLQISALRLGGLVNRADLARDAALSRPTTHRWLNLLEVSFQLRLLRAFAAGRAQRLVKSPKLYWTDTGLAAHLAGIFAPDELPARPGPGALLENLLLVQLDTWRETLAPRPEIFHWRTAAGAEVDFVVEHGRRLLPIEVKSRTSAQGADAAHLEQFLDRHPAAPWGLVVHTGRELYLLSPRVLAAPLARLLAPLAIIPDRA